MTDLNPENLNEMTPTDPGFDALLDEALAPVDVPAGLNDRILAATADRLSGVENETAEETPAVIARIGDRFAWRSIAAVLLFALVIGGMWLANQDSDTTDPIPPTHNVAGGDLNAEIEAALDQLAEAELEAEWIDDRIDILSMQVTWAQDKRDAGVWGNDALESLDTAIARETFDDVSEQLDWYF